METGKSSNSETSKKNSEDDPNDQEQKALEKPKYDDNTGIGRSYECTFCKRGFTNAQALGGHMNIHRKDKAAKAKSKPRNPIQEEPKVSLFGNIDCSRYFQGDASISSQSSTLDKYKVYLQPSPNPSFQIANDVLPVRMELGQTEQLGLTNENLSLRIGLTNYSTSTSEENGGEQTAKKNDEVDLELRLGHDP